MTKKVWFAGILSLVFVVIFSFVAMADDSIILTGKWSFQFDDDLAWADPEYDVSDWETYTNPADAPALGFGWYRLDFEVPAEWEGKGDLELSIAELYDFDWSFVNGIGVGNGNRSGNRKYSVPASYLNYGGKNTLALRIYTINPGIGLDGEIKLSLTGVVSMVKNPSFEQAVNLPLGWTPTRTDKNIFIWENAATVRTGFRALALKGTDALEGEEAAWMSDIILVKPGTEYRAQAYVKAEDPTGETTIQIRFYNADGDEVFYDGERAVSRNLARRTADWTRGNLIGTAPEDAVYARIFLVSNDNSGIVWFDDVSFGAE